MQCKTLVVHETPSHIRHFNMLKHMGVGKRRTRSHLREKGMDSGSMTRDEQMQVADLQALV